jgi:hypothetical protein
MILLQAYVLAFLRFKDYEERHEDETGFYTLLYRTHYSFRRVDEVDAWFVVTGARDRANSGAGQTVPWILVTQCAP